MLKSVHMVLKGVNWVHIDRIRSNGLKGVIGCTKLKSGSYGLERSQLCTQ